MFLFALKLTFLLPLTEPVYNFVQMDIMQIILLENVLWLFFVPQPIHMLIISPMNALTFVQISNFLISLQEQLMEDNVCFYVPMDISRTQILQLVKLLVLMAFLLKQQIIPVLKFALMINLWMK